MFIFTQLSYRIGLFGLLCVLLMVSMTTASVRAQELDPKQFREIAADLVQGLNDTQIGRISSSAGYEAPKVALRSLAEGGDLSKYELGAINSYLIAHLHRLGGQNFHFIDRSNLKTLVDERDRYGSVAGKEDALNILLENSQADILIIGRVSKSRGHVSLSYQAVATHSGQVLVSTSPRTLAYLQRKNALQITKRTFSIQRKTHSGNSIYRATIEQAEIRLFELGYEPGIADGYLTDETRTALRNYQSDSALQVNGRLTRQTFNNLFLDTRLVD